MPTKLFSFLVVHPLNTNRPFISIINDVSEDIALGRIKLQYGSESTFTRLTADQVSEHSAKGVIVYITE